MDPPTFVSTTSPPLGASTTPPPTPPPGPRLLRKPPPVKKPSTKPTKRDVPNARSTISKPPPASQNVPRKPTPPTPPAAPFTPPQPTLPTTTHTIPRKPVPGEAPPFPLLTTAATTFALKAYLTAYLHALGWNPTVQSAPSFISEYSWLLAAEMSLPAPQAAKIFLEIFEATTPTMGTVCQALLGVREKLKCGEEEAKGLRRLWERNQGVGVEEFLIAGGEDKGMRVEVSVGGNAGVKAKRRVGGGFAGVVRGVMARSKSTKK